MKLTYAKIRFVPDIVSGEFMNVGIVAYDWEKKEVQFHWPKGVPSRLESFFGSEKADLYEKSYKMMIAELKRVNRLSKEIPENGFMLYQSLVRPSDNVIQFNGESVTINPNASVMSIFEEYVTY